MDRPGGSRLSAGDRRALLAVGGQFFLNGAMTASFIARAPQIRDRIGVDLDRFGLLLTAAAAAGLLGSLVAGRVIHALGTRRVLRAGAVVMVVSLPVIGGATSPEVWLLGMLAYLFVDVLVDISMNLQGSWISARRRAPVMHRLHGLWSLGTLAGGAGAVAANAAGWSPLVHLAVVAGAAGAALALAGLHLLAHDEERHAEVLVPPGPQEPPVPITGSDPAPAPPGRAARTPVVLLALAGMCAVVPEVTAGDWAAFRLTDDLGATAALGSAAFAAYTLGMTAMRFGGDWLQLRWGRDRLRRTSITVAAAGILLAALVPSEAVALVGFLVVGLGVATFMPGLYDDAARLPGRRGAGLGAMTGGMRVALLVTPAAVGGLAATALSVGAAIAVVTVPPLVGLAVVSEVNHRLLRRHAAAASP